MMFLGTDSHGHFTRCAGDGCLKLIPLEVDFDELINDRILTTFTLLDAGRFNDKQPYCAACAPTCAPASEGATS